MKFAWILALTLVTGCTSLESTKPRTMAAAPYRTFSAPMARVKPAMIATLASMGMMISSLEVRGGREILKARKAGSQVEIELEPVTRSSTRARISASNSSLSYDKDTAAKILLQTEKILGNA